MSFQRKKASNEPITEELARQKAMRLLGRREHSAKQLAQKLTASGVERAGADVVVQKLGEDGWQSDSRFAQALVQSRIAQGYGPLRIRAELQMAGLPRGEVSQVMDNIDADWLALCAAAHARKCDDLPRTAADRARQWRQLAQRGFDSEQISAVLRGEAAEAG